MTATAPQAQGPPAEAELERGGIRFLRTWAARSVLEDAQRRGVAVLGLDAFFLTAEATRPSLQDSVNFYLPRRN